MLRKTAPVLVVFCVVTTTVGVARDLPSSDTRRLSYSRPALAAKLAMNIRNTELDCSHFTHYLYERAGLFYAYANSIELYEGVDSFVRVRRPLAGDLVVWRGHVGIVIDPRARTFISKLRKGVKVMAYDHRYWRRKGTPRFLRYAPRSVPRMVLAHREWREARGATE